MSAHPLATFAQMRQRPDAGPLLPTPKPGRHRRDRTWFRLRAPRRTPAEKPTAPAVLKPVDLRP